MGVCGGISDGDTEAEAIISQDRLRSHYSNGTQ